MRIEDLDTPVPVIDLDRVEANLVRMQSYCDHHGLKLRPHIKTHKLPQFAKRQIELGAVGITCQKISEAMVFAEAGCGDILLSYPIVGDSKVMPLATLARKATISVAIDNDIARETVGAAAEEAGREIGILVEFESGAKRTGVQTPEEALELARRVKATKGLEFRGFMTYPHGPGTGPFLAAAKPLFAAAGIPIKVVSAGGTPRFDDTHEITGVTELRVGTYIYNDRAIVGAGSATLDDCALHVIATVISRPTHDRAILDCGSKSLSSDRVDPKYGDGYGLIREYPEAVIERLNEEHGIVDLSRCSGRPQIGDRVRIVPNHVCVVTNLHDEVVACRGQEVVGVWPVAARGRTR